MSADNEGSPPPSPSLDYALLESLFYNEMMMIDNPSSVSSDFMAYLSSENDGEGDGAPDARTIAERAMLSDFGVAQLPSSHHNLPSGQQEPKKTEELSQNRDIARNNIVTTSTSRGQSGTAQPECQASSSSSMPLQERAKHLVTQFANLAGRLGLSIPTGLLSSLTQHATLSDGSGAGAVASNAKLEHSSSSTLDGGAAEPSGSGNDEAAGHLQRTAEAAISAANSRKRPQTDNNGAGGKVPLYSKRRKKPRLSDCESKLASLKAENEMLKRHLANVSNRSEKFEDERKRQELEMRSLADNGASPSQLRPLLSKFSEMYSDYGRHRDEELSFHLKQLERLAAPTNFTKMGLWTLGQSDAFYTDLKRNPIAGILRKELGITPQQGRKIIEKRQKIRDLCANLKECLALLAKLKTICEQKQKVYHDRMSKCQQILAPHQVVKLVVWVDEHTDILEQVCPGWGSERIHSK